MGATIDSGSTKYSNADKDEFAHQTEVQRDLPSVEEGGEAPIVEDAVFGEQGGKDTLNYRTFVLPLLHCAYVGLTRSRAGSAGAGLPS